MEEFNLAEYIKEHPSAWKTREPMRCGEPRTDRAAYAIAILVTLGIATEAEAAVMRGRLQGAVPT